MGPVEIVATVLASLITILFSAWIKNLHSKVRSVCKKIDALKMEVDHIKLMRAEEGGKKQGADDLLWREINTDKHKIATLHNKIDKAFEKVDRMQEVMSRIGEPTFPRNKN